MGRSIPSGANLSIHPILAFSFIAAGIAASIAIIATLCASCHRKSSPEKPSSKYPPPSPRSNRSSRKEKAEEATATATAIELPHEHQQQQQQHLEIPPTPAEKVVLDVATHGPILPSTALTEQSSRRRLSMSLSMKLPEGLSKIRTGKKERKAAVEEETIWKKTIILGEKCRVPSEDGDDETCGEKGSRQRSYHPRTPRSLPVSRTNSFANSEMFTLP